MASTRGPRRPQHLLRSSWAFLLALIAGESTIADGLSGETGVREKIAGIQIPFIANRGQTSAIVAFYAPTSAGMVYVTRDGKIVYSLPASQKEKPGWTLTENFSGGRARPRARKSAETRVSYFLGNDRERWRGDLPTYESVELGEVWRGVNVSLQARGRKVEKLFTVLPGASTDSIRMQVGGAEALRTTGSGELIVGTGLGEVSFSVPVAYQVEGDLRVPVAVAYRVGGDEYGFRLGTFNPALPLTIDPVLQSTYLGGSGLDDAFSVTSRPGNGEVLVAGFAGSIDFPGVAEGAQQTFGGGGGDAFVARFDPALTTLLQATFLGGAGGELAWALAVHPATGEVIVAGDTGSGDFPGVAGGAQGILGGEADVFAARLDPSLTTLHQATYLGGRSIDTPRGLAVDPGTGDVFIVGLTSSLDFPKTAGGAQSTFGGGFGARLNSALTELRQSTFLGGVDDVAVGVAIHLATSEVLIAGGTGSPAFPAVASGAQPAFGGFRDGFIARLDPALNALLGSTYFGGSGLDAIDAVAVASATGEVIVAGITSSANLPGTAGAAQATFGGGALDGFAARLNATLSTLLRATYVGGSGGDGVNAMTIHPSSGEIFVAGGTDSTDLPGTAGGIQPNRNFSEDAFAVRLSPSLGAVIQATYLGGSDRDSARSIAIHGSSGELLLAGRTTSNDFPGTAGGAQPTRREASESDAFAARLTSDLAGLQPTTTPGASPAEVPTLSLRALVLLAVALATVGLLLVRKSV